jgi:Leucine-rich repeat (LRR) protein
MCNSGTKIIFQFFRRFLLFVSCWTLISSAFGQYLDSAQLEEQPIFYSFEQADTVNLDLVYRLAFKRKLPENFQQKIVQYPNLQELHLNRMKLKEIPEILFSLENLTVLDLSNNKLENISPKIGNLHNLERLILNRNYILSLPAEISNLSELYYLDLWSNLIIEFPKEINALQHSLRTVDMRVINMNDEHKELLQLLLPNTKFFFSKSCNCKM